MMEIQTKERNNTPTSLQSNLKPGLKISVVVVVLNGVRTIRETLNSVFRQTYTHYEIIVADGNSSDGTQQVLADYGDKITWWSRPDSGTSQAMNAACAQASGDLFIFLNSDDYLADENVFSDAINFFYHNPDTDLLCGDLKVIDERKRIELGVVRSKVGPQSRWITIQFAGSFSRRWLWENKKFDETMSIANDHEAICGWIHTLKGKVAYQARTNIIFRLGGISNSVNKAQLVARERFIVRSRYDHLPTAYVLYGLTSAMNLLRRMRIRPFFWWRSCRIAAKNYLNHSKQPGS